MPPMLNDVYQSIDPVIFSAGPFTVRWYGLAYVLGFLFAGLMVYRVARHWKIRFDAYDVLVFVCYCSIGIILGARVGYCLLYGDGYYFEHPAKILAVQEGGMSFHGGLVGVVLAGFIYARVYRMPFLTLADLVACGAPIGLFFGRCANFINGELYGAETDWPVGVDFTGSGTLYQPSQLYEALLEGVVLFCILFALSRKCAPPRPRGFFLGTFLVFYGVFRILIEFVRLPDVQIGYFFGTWGTMGQLLSLPMVLLGAALVAYALVRKLPQCGMPAPCGAEGAGGSRGAAASDVPEAADGPQTAEPQADGPQAEGAQDAESQDAAALAGGTQDAGVSATEGLQAAAAGSQVAEGPTRGDGGPDDAAAAPACQR